MITHKREIMNQDVNKGSSSDFLQFLELVGRLKHLARTGWVKRNVDQPETISGHMYRMAMMTFLMDDSSSLSQTRCMEMALVHDLAESIIGDITPYCGVDPEEKRKNEMAAMIKIGALLGPKGNRIVELFKEYENQETPEAKFVKELDLFDMRLQAYEYEKKEKSPGRLEEFKKSTDSKFTSPLIVSLDKELERIRNAFIANDYP